MKLPEVSVKNPVMTVMIFLGVILLGAFSLTRLKIDLMPDIEPPQVSVITIWPGASATDVEMSVTKYIEDQLTKVANLERLTSKSLEGLSVVTCRFKWGTDLDAATSDVRDALELAKRDLPSDIEPPMIFKFSTATIPVLYMFLSAQESYPQLYYLADKVVGDELKRIPGVGTIMIQGGLQRQINVRFDPRRLEAYGLSLEEVGRVLSLENLDVPAGEIKLEKMAYAIRIPGRFKDPEEAKKIVVGVKGGRIIRLEDVAEISDSFKEPSRIGYGNGKPAVVLAIQKQVGANTVEVVDKINKRLKEIKRLLPPDVEMVPVFDSSEFIRVSLKNLRETLYIGLFLVSLVTFFFLRRFWASTIILLTIPFSLIGSFILMLLFGYTINAITLSALAIASGMVVDDAIVVLENIMRHIERGARPKVASIFGTSEVGLAVSTATLTIVVVFVPLMFISGLTGIFFKQLAFVITATIMASLFNALTLTPMLSSKFLKPPQEIGKGFWAEIDRRFERAFRKIEEGYKRLIGWALGNRIKVIGITGLVFLMSLLLIPFIGTELTPEMDSGEVRLTFRLPEGTRVEETQRVLEEIQKKVIELVPERRSFFGYCGQSERGVATALGFEEGSNVGMVGLKLVEKSQRKRSAKEVGLVLREAVSQIPGIKEFYVSATAAIGQLLMGGGGRRLSIELWGKDLDLLVSYADELKKRIEKIPGTLDVTISQRPPRPEIWVQVDREKASQLGLNTGLIASSLRQYFYGFAPTTYRESGEDYDIFLRLRDEYKNQIKTLGEVPIKTLSGAVVPLRNVAQIREAYGPVSIERRDRQRVVKVESDVKGRPLGDVVADIQKVIKEMKIPPEIGIRFGGETEEQQKAFKDLKTLFVLGVILVYMVMASLFKSYRHPFVIMFSLPFAVSGALFALFFTGTTLSLYSFLGLIMLLGIVTKNAIVLVDYTNILREREFPLREAIKEAGRTRLRPVLMTTLTTLFGMIPMALSRGEGSEMWSSLGITMIGGLTVSTLVTLVLVPVIYSLVEERRR
jgi:HAE1 family hydrophobic/amphiphilic exporter-1